MTFRQFAFNNVKRNSRQYLSYFFSCMFSVAVFFIYAVIMFHPEIQHHDFRDIVRSGITAAEVVIFGFSFLFVLYSTGAFIKSRKKEYGILMTLGISKGQLNRLLILENSIIGLVSIFAGMLVGMLFANLFIMGFSNLLGLENSLGFQISWKAFLLTFVGYFLMFELNSLLVVWTLRINSIVSLFQGARGPKQTPKFSWILAIIGLGLVIAAYYLAWTSDLMSIGYRMMPILGLIIPGTYLLFTQFSVLFIHLLKKNKNLYFKKTNLLTISELGYKLKDHARLLFFVTILSAVAFTASGVLYGVFESAESEASIYVPQDVAFLSKGEENIEKMGDEVSKFTNTLDEQKIDYQSLTVDRAQAKTFIDNTETWLDIIPYSDYKSILELNGEKVTEDLADNEMMVMLAHAEMALSHRVEDELTLESENHQETLQTKIVPSIVNSNYHTRNTVVVNDDVYDDFAAVAEPNEKYRYTAFTLDDWVANAELVQETTAKLDHEIVSGIDSKANIYLTLKNSLSYALFFGLFISVLFFLAAGSILYFKMYQDLDKDVRQYQALYRVGLTISEMKKIATQQVAYLFFIPFILAVIHAGFAFKALQNMLESSVLMPSVTLISAYLLVYAIYFFFIRGLYIRKIKQVM
ncbi:putative ABC transport system permease protein [Gracilibacillus orientalis]|uniref:Putative ABC transport system permease protein n=1 Tax=Gracilibacillus orientalis TaxID=334253 RepID=A0A1I4QZ14_9BACI|nr:FtsX-like permease family protein [Gracilibacillus orientalis]SFM44960.1 putative ABC transport system permease protein [Gracilibacillus orientalis]